MNKENLLKIMHSELLLTMGCTDPAAIAFAAAAAVFPDTKTEIDFVEMWLDRNILKNAQAVIIPGTTRCGIEFSAALGIVLGNHENGILLFKGLKSEDVIKADALCEKTAFYINCNRESDHIYIRLEVTYKSGLKTSSLIEYKHDNLIHVKKNDSYVFKSEERSPELELKMDKDNVFSLSDMICCIESLTESELSFLGEAFKINEVASLSGLNPGAGSEFGLWLQNLYSCECSSRSSVIMETRWKVAAATDARMGGLNVPVMACGGSGNHGLTFFITLSSVLKIKQAEPDLMLLQSSALGLIILHYIKEFTGILTPMCGCAMAAGMAAAVSIVWYWGGKEKEMMKALNFVMGFLGGIVCDGAKRECSLKTSLSAQVAMESAFLALDGAFIDVRAGFFAETLSQILNNLEILHKKGMKGFDEVMVNILLGKKK